MFGTALTDEGRQRAYRGQSLITCGDRTLSLLLDVAHEPSHQIGAELLHQQFIRLSVQRHACEDNQQPQCITVAVLCVSSKVALCGKVLQQEALDPGRQGGAIFHRRLRAHSARNDDLPVRGVPASSSSSAGSHSDRHGQDKWTEQEANAAHPYSACTTPSLDEPRTSVAGREGVAGRTIHRDARCPRSVASERNTFRPPAV